MVIPQVGVIGSNASGNANVYCEKGATREDAWSDVEPLNDAVNVLPSLSEYHHFIVNFAIPPWTAMVREWIERFRVFFDKRDRPTRYGARGWTCV